MSERSERPMTFMPTPDRPTRTGQHDERGAGMSERMETTGAGA
jgi:hypothetical protein